MSPPLQQMASGYTQEIVSVMRDMDLVHSAAAPGTSVVATTKHSAEPPGLCHFKAWTLLLDRIGVCPRPGRTKSRKPFPGWRSAWVTQGTGEDRLGGDRVGDVARAHEHTGPAGGFAWVLVGAWPSSGLVQHFLEDCVTPRPGQAGPWWAKSK